MKLEFSGRVWKYGDNINTDVLFPGKYTYQKMEPAEMAGHALEDLDPNFAAAVNPGDIIVAGRNFGMGSSREQAASALKYAGITVIIAESFARIYFRNAINQGIPAIKCPEAVAVIKNGQTISVDLAKGQITTFGGGFTFPPYPATVMRILENDGLINYIKTTIKHNNHIKDK